LRSSRKTIVDGPDVTSEVVRAPRH
jgi:hypothetical protein